MHFATRTITTVERQKDKMYVVRLKEKKFKHSLISNSKRRFLIVSSYKIVIDDKLKIRKMYKKNT